MNANLHNAAIFFDRVTRLDIEDWHDAFFQEAIESGGTYLVSEGQHWPASHLVEIHLHGILGHGMTEEEAQRAWIRMTRRQIRANVTNPTEAAQ